MCGDGSNKNFFRITEDHSSQRSYVLMELEEDNKITSDPDQWDWTNIAATLQQAQVKLPKIIATQQCYNSIIIEDCGRNILADIINQKIAKDNLARSYDYFSQCHSILYKLSNINPDINSLWCKRKFDRFFFERELTFFKTHYLSCQSQINIKKFDQDVSALSLFLDNFCKHFTHRDFHCRNLLLNNKELFVIDFQDARLGPIAYDLVSLTFDPYINLKTSQRLKLHNKAILGYDKQLQIEIQKTWKPVLLQRLLKAIGSFAYLDNKNKKFPYKYYIKPAIKILLDLDLYNDKWPYLSKQLIKELGNNEKVE
jgi:aminoglycoside/choline kinase family phosphotransferase